MAETYGAGNSPFLAGAIIAPVGCEVVKSADYKAVDPAVAIIDCQGATALQLVVSPTANSGGGGVTVTISAVDPSTQALTTLLASVLITGTSPVVLEVDPRITAAANTIAQKSLPAKVSVAFVGSGTRTTLTYSASATLQN